MIDGSVFGELFAGALVVVRFVGVQATIQNDILEKCLADRLGVEFFDMERTRRAFALDQGDNLLLGLVAAHFLPALAVHEDLARPANEKLIGLYNLVPATERRRIG